MRLKRSRAFVIRPSASASPLPRTIWYTTRTLTGIG